MSRFQMTRQVEIRSIHHLENKALSVEENKKLYGLCYGTHGHNYKVQVTLGGLLQRGSMWVANRDQVDVILKREIVDQFDGIDLNDKLPNTACEALAEVFYNRLQPFFPNTLIRVSIQETRKNYFEFPAET